MIPQEHTRERLSIVTGLAAAPFTMALELAFRRLTYVTLSSYY